MAASGNGGGRGGFEGGESEEEEREEDEEGADCDGGLGFGEEEGGLKKRRWGGE